MSKGRRGRSDIHRNIDSTSSVATTLASFTMQAQSVIVVFISRVGASARTGRRATETSAETSPAPHSSAEMGHVDRKLTKGSRAKRAGREIRGRGEGLVITEVSRRSLKMADETTSLVSPDVGERIEATKRTV